MLVESCTLLLWPHLTTTWRLRTGAAPGVEVQRSGLPPPLGLAQLYSALT